MEPTSLGQIYEWSKSFWYNDFLSTKSLKVRKTITTKGKQIRKEKMAHNNRVRKKLIYFFMATVSKNIWNTKKKMPGFGTHIFWKGIPRDHKNAQMKIFYMYPGEKFRFFKFKYWKMPEICLKMAILSIQIMMVKFFGNTVHNRIAYSNHSNSLDMFGHKNFENQSFFLWVVTSFSMKNTC